MEVGKVSFSDKGFNDFESLTRKEQKEFLKSKVPLQINFDKDLTNVNYAKRKGVAKKVKESKQIKSTTKGSREDSFDGHGDKELKEG
jgi:cell division protein FtsX